MVPKSFKPSANPEPVVMGGTATRKPPAFLHIKALVVIAIVSCTMYGISKAVDAAQPAKIQNFSAIGVVYDIDASSLLMDSVRSSDKTDDASYIFDLKGVEKVEDSSYGPLSISDIKDGDKILVQGIDRDGTIAIRRIVSLSSGTTTEQEATGTGQTAADGASASAVPSVASTSGDISASASPAIGTTTDPVATTTAVATSTQVAPSPIATTTDDVSTSTDPVATTTPAVTTTAATSTLEAPPMDLLPTEPTSSVQVAPPTDASSTLPDIGSAGPAPAPADSASSTP